MRVAILGSVSITIPPEGQGALEWIAYWQARGLAEDGHKILLFAPKGSKVPGVTTVEVGEGKTASGVGREKRSGGEEIYGSSYKLRLEIANLAGVIDGLIKRQDQFDLILNNLRGESVFLPICHHLIKKGVVHVLHLPVFEELACLFEKFNTPLISLSFAQRKAFPNLNYVGNIPNGVDTKRFAYSERVGDYLLYLGSMGRNKNPKDALLAAKKGGEKIIFGGRIKDARYYKEELEPLIDDKGVKWVGEVTQDEVIKLYQGAKAFLFPTLWEEPFGLVLIEAMACGTPVIAYGNGAVPEVVRDGVTGFVVESEAVEIGSSRRLGRPQKFFRSATRSGNNAGLTMKVSSLARKRTEKILWAPRAFFGEKTVAFLPQIKGRWQIKKRGVEGLVEGIKRIGEIDRKKCRQHVEKNFTFEKMVEKYERVLEEVVSKKV